MPQGLWHYAPGSVSTPVPIGLMVGSALMGLYLSLLAKKTGTLWWSMLAHALGGLVMIL